MSAVAVVVSLIFVGWQTRQNTLAQRSQTRQALSDASREATLTLATDLEMVERVGTYLNAPMDSVQAALTDAEMEQVSLVLWAFMRNAENVFLQSEEGVVGRDVLGTYGFVGRYFSTPNFPIWWARARELFQPDFVKAFEAANSIRTP